MSERRGALALVLHTHMPYVEGFGTWPFGEEWLWEAVACVYLPLLDLLDGAPVTIGLTPVLCDQLEAMRGEPGDRYLRLPARGARRRCTPRTRTGSSAAASPSSPPRCAARRATTSAPPRASSGAAAISSGRSAPSRGVELWTSSATHAVLPLLATDAGAAGSSWPPASRRTGAASAAGAAGSGCPSAPTRPGSSDALAEHGVRRFCVDQTAAHGLGAPEQLEPVALDSGPVAVPVDWQTVELVWNERDGYPGHAAYRDYHRRTIHDLRPWANSGEPYDREAALALARGHARDFLRHVARDGREGGGLVCCALDTELLGHWWYEGPEWLAAVIDQAEEEGVELVTRRRGGGAHAGGAARARAVELGGRQGPLDLGRPRGGRAGVRRPPRRAAHGGRGGQRRGRRARPSSARRASCWRSRRATGPS